MPLHINDATHTQSMVITNAPLHLIGNPQNISVARNADEATNENGELVFAESHINCNLFK